MTTRRKVLLALGAAGLATLSLSALPQQDKRVRRIGYVSAANVASNASYLAAFRQGMSELRWIEGRDYSIDARYSNGISQAMEGMAAEIVATQPDLLLAGGDAVARLYIQKTKTIPIVFTIAQDPVGNGLVASLRQPGGNATGLTILAAELSPKRLQLLKEAFPHVSHVVVLFDPLDLGSRPQVTETEQAAARLNIRVTLIELQQASDIEPAFKRGTALGTQAYIATQGGVMNIYNQAIADRIMRLRMPAISGNNVYADAGGLMSYGASIPDNFHRAAAYVEKILKGAKPGDLPVEQPTKFELVINMKTAKAMGFKIPQSILLRADRVIE
jgi:putative ABC transport system substrate-binding protein